MLIKLNHIKRILRIFSTMTLLIVFCGFSLVNPIIEKKIAVKELSASKKVRYKKDATRLALRLISNNNEYLTMKAEVPSDMVNSIYDALVAVHQSDLLEAQLVTHNHKLHTFPVPTVDNFIVIYQRNIPWARPLRLGDNETESTEINDFCKDYKLIIDNNVQWDEEHNSFNVKALQAMNIAPIAAKFKSKEGVTSVEVLAPNGDGNDIEILKTEDGWSISYIVKFDSCFTGCKKRHFWKFNVSPTGQVNFLEEGGDQLPVWMTK